ncbi:hypothetical protein [Photorhabdus asymbiotica]|uniref:hypothetical protein n=1 Tax=Photorhabdus asymbiotica TaxID=291112 RepID=UPI003DA6EC32
MFHPQIACIEQDRACLSLPPYIVCFYDADIRFFYPDIHTSVINEFNVVQTAFLSRFDIDIFLLYWWLNVNGSRDEKIENVLPVFLEFNPCVENRHCTGILFSTDKTSYGPASAFGLSSMSTMVCYLMLVITHRVLIIPFTNR